MAAADDLFEDARRTYVPLIERVAEASEDDPEAEDRLAEILDSIHKDSIRQLRLVAEQPRSADALLNAVTAWASLTSYATTRFYLEGPHSQRKKGGFSTKVAAHLQDAAASWSPFLKEAVKTMNASAFTISVGLPLGVSVGLTWDVRDLADTVRAAARALKGRPDAPRVDF
jgi:hypothetical protein